MEDENIADVPIAILLNKIDLPSCIGEAAFVFEFDLFHKKSGTVSVPRIKYNMKYT